MGLTILLADNSMAAQNLGKKILTDAGYDVVTVSNGVAAGKKITELHPDIALLDVYMAGYTGVEICEKTKATPETAQIPVLLTVGKIEPFRAEEGIKVKADGVITKPFEANDLIAVVERLTRSAHAPETTILSEPVGLPADSPHSSATDAIPAARAANPEARAVMQVPASVAAPSAQASLKPLAVVARPSPLPSVTPAKAPPSSCSQATVKPSPPLPSPSAQLSPKPAKPVPSPASAAQPKPQSPRFSPQGGEICDVCGHVNPERAIVCQECDVPLPSSLSLHKPGAFHVQ